MEETRHLLFTLVPHLPGVLEVFSPHPLENRSYHTNCGAIEA